MNKGLSQSQVQELLKEHGYNELPSSKPKSVWKIAFEVMKEPMFLLLISCALLYMILGDYREGIILLSSIFIIIFITFYQYQKTEKALDALKNLASPRALVIRDGVEVRIPGREVVPGDLLVVNEGDRISADATIIESLNLSVDESMLTGESVPVSKMVSTDSSNPLQQLFSGTLIVRGKGLAEVVVTGAKTKFGGIGASLEKIVPEGTRLQKEMKALIKALFIIGGFVSVGVVAAFYFTRGNFIQSLLSGLASSMAILPEEFPVILTVFLALGAWRLSKINVLTRSSSAIETLGSATVLCSDKTGTITQNKMEVVSLFDGRSFTDKIDYTKKKESIADLIVAARRASVDDSIDPMEKAIFNINDLFGRPKESKYKLVKEYPFSHELTAMTRIYKNDETGEFYISAKGAPETIIGLCKDSDDANRQHLDAVQKMAERGLRVIAVARGSMLNNSIPEKLSELKYQFIGLVGLEDPIRPEVPNAIKECKEAGIKVVMITGDFPITARSIGQQIGLSSEGETMTGDVLEKLSDEELRARIEKVNIFARVVPEQKLRIVNAYKANNEIVAMTGDGVNDAPALKAAQIGIAMGNKGTDVAREASSLVLLDDNFASIVSGIRAGRRIFDNLQKAMSYVLAIHIPIIGLAFLPSFIVSLPILLMPLHIVFMELIIDPVCSIAFESEQEEKGIMNRKPRDPEDKFFGGKRIMRSVLQGAILLAMVMIVYFFSISEGHSEGEVRAITFTSLILGNIFLIVTDLSRTKNFISVLLEKNSTILLILAIALIMLFLIITVPSLQVVFSFEFPGYRHFIPPLVGAFSMLMVFEIAKLVRVKKAEI